MFIVTCTAYNYDWTADMSNFTPGILLIYILMLVFVILAII